MLEKSISFWISSFSRTCLQQLVRNKLCNRGGDVIPPTPVGRASARPGPEGKAEPRGCAARSQRMTGHCGSATFRLGPFQFTATKPGKAPVGLEEARRDLRTSRPNRRTWTNPTLRQSPQAREGRSPGSVRRHKRRGHRRLRRGRQTRLKRLCFQARQPRPVKAGWERTDE